MTYRNGGGGGGAGGPGEDPIGTASVRNNVDGGVGLESSITGAPVFYAGGGSGTAGLGGVGGGGNSNGSPGQANTGGGGGGGNSYNANGGGAGGSGVVILRTFITASATTGSPTVTTDGLYNIYTFTASGSITF